MTLEELAGKLGIELNDETKGSITAYVTAQTGGLKTNNRDLLAQVSSLKTKLKAFDGIDPEDLAALTTELEIEPADLIDRVRNAPKAAGDAAKAAEAAAEAKYQRKITAAERRAQEAEAKVEAANKARVDEAIARTLTDELAKKKGNVDLLLPSMKGRVKGAVGEDGKIIITVLAANGDELMSDAGAPGTIGDLVESYRRDERFGIAFEADGGGSGAGNGGTRKPAGGQRNPFKKATWNLTEQSKLRATNPALADQLKREAELAG